VLADELAGAGPDGVEAALAAFVARRAARVAHVQETTHRRDRLRYAPPLLRRASMRLAGQRLFRSHYRPLLAPP
jgi:2-polyprenyl-6-methoxyphenol hydroxylase-like FAD-dependent oxidoreductase